MTKPAVKPEVTPPSIVPVSGVWLRKLGDSVEVLIEVNETWHSIINEYAYGTINHVVGGEAMLATPKRKA